MDAAFSSPLDTLSIAMSSAPKSLPVLSNIYKIATDIRETSQRVEINKQQSELLSERIDTIIGFLADRDLSACLNESLHKALNRFETFLRQCLEFISSFLETSWFKRITNSKEYEKKFLDLNRELTQYSNDINFGIGLMNMDTNRNKDKSHRVENVSGEVSKADETAATSKSPNMIDKTPNIEKKHQESPIETNSIPFMNMPEASIEAQLPYASIFVPGLWLYQYFQFNQTFGPFQQEIIFNPMTKKLKGRGIDNVGQYLLKGTFSDETGQIEMIQQYQFGTGNPALNIGHRQLIRIGWNPLKGIFEGTVYSETCGQNVPVALIEMFLP